MSSSDICQPLDQALVDSESIPLPDALRTAAHEIECEQEDSISAKREHPRLVRLSNFPGLLTSCLQHPLP